MRYIALLVMMILSAAAAQADLADYADVEVRGSTDWDTITETVTYVNQNPDPVEPGNYVEVRFKLENIGAGDAKDVVVELVPKFPFSLDPGVSPQKSIGDINAWQVGEDAYVIYYKVRVDPDAVQGENDLHFRYSLDKGNQWYEMKPFKVRVQVREAPLSVVNVMTVPELIAPGSTAKLTLALKNMANQRLRDIKVTLQIVTTLTAATSITQTELPFVPVGSTNEKMLMSLEPGQQATVDFSLAVDPNSEVGIYKLPVVISYADDFGTNYTKSNYIGLKVGEKPDVVVTLDDSDIYTRDSKGTATIRFVNKGNSDLKFLYVKLAEDDDFDILSAPEVYLGNVDSDDYETADFELKVKDGDGPVMLPLTLEFRDAHNSIYTKKYDIDLRLYSDEQAEEFGLTEGNSKVGIVIVVVIVVCGLGIYIWMRKRKKK
jgi:hypothetical protein